MRRKESLFSAEGLTMQRCPVAPCSSVPRSESHFPAMRRRVCQAQHRAKRSMSCKKMNEGTLVLDFQGMWMPQDGHALNVWERNVIWLGQMYNTFSCAT